jgi:hypothetical protein
MLAHLLRQHRAKGQRVPDAALDELRAETEIDDSIVEVLFTPDRSCKAEIKRRRDGQLQVWLLREVPADSEYESEAYWSPVGRDAILTDTLERAKALAEEALRSCMDS